jgi:hypothetical protein
VKTRTPGRQFTDFSRFSAFSAVTGAAKRKNSLQMRRFQTISEFSHSLGRFEPLAGGRGAVDDLDEPRMAGELTMLMENHVI